MQTIPIHYFDYTTSRSSSLNFAPAINAQNAMDYQNIHLRDALCSQNWVQAIAVIDRMRQTTPNYDKDLDAYRADLVHLRNSRTRLPGWPSAVYCSGESRLEYNTNINNSSPSSTQNTSTSSQPSLRSINHNHSTVPTFSNNHNNNNNSVIPNSAMVGEYPPIAPHANCRWISLVNSQETRYVNGYWNCGL